MNTAPAEPGTIGALDHDKHGRPIPWFVLRGPNGEPDFRCAPIEKVPQALAQSLCWICGSSLSGLTPTFVIGPMCVINRVSPEPPSHYPCATYSVKACPFLARPAMRRRDTALPENRTLPPGHAIMRNPGVTCVWASAGWSLIPEGAGYLFDIGEPRRVWWYTQGRPATRDEILESIDSGLPELQKAAEETGPEAVAALGPAYLAALTLLPDQ